MSSIRYPRGPVLIAGVVLIGTTCLLSGCGGGDDNAAVQTPEMRNHMQEITKNYGAQYAAKYGRKGAARKK